LKRPVLGKCLSRFGDQRLTRIRELGGAMDGHAAADAVTERDEPIEA
jgi:hypothetical protein